MFRPSLLLVCVALTAATSFHCPCFEPTPCLNLATFECLNADSKGACVSKLSNSIQIHCGNGEGAGAGLGPEPIDLGLPSSSPSTTEDTSTYDNTETYEGIDDLLNDGGGLGDAMSDGDGLHEHVNNLLDKLGNTSPDDLREHVDNLLNNSGISSEDLPDDLHSHVGDILKKLGDPDTSPDDLHEHVKNLLDSSGISHEDLPEDLHKHVNNLLNGDNTSPDGGLHEKVNGLLDRLNDAAGDSPSTEISTTDLEGLAVGADGEDPTEASTTEPSTSDASTTEFEGVAVGAAGEDTTEASSTEFEGVQVSNDESTTEFEGIANEVEDEMESSAIDSEEELDESDRSDDVSDSEWESAPSTIGTGDVTRCVCWHTKPCSAASPGEECTVPPPGAFFLPGPSCTSQYFMCQTLPASTTTTTTAETTTTPTTTSTRSTTTTARTDSAKKIVEVDFVFPISYDELARKNLLSAFAHTLLTGLADVLDLDDSVAIQVILKPGSVIAQVNVQEGPYINDLRGLAHSGVCMRFLRDQVCSEPAEQQYASSGATRRTAAIIGVFIIAMIVVVFLFTVYQAIRRATNSQAAQNDSAPFDPLGINRPVPMAKPPTYTSLDIPTLPPPSYEMPSQPEPVYDVVGDPNKVYDIAGPPSQDALSVTTFRQPMWDEPQEFGGTSTLPNATATVVFMDGDISNNTTSSA